MRPPISTAPSFCNLAVYINHLRITEMEKYEISSYHGLVFFVVFLLDGSCIHFFLSERLWDFCGLVWSSYRIKGEKKECLQCDILHTSGLCRLIICLNISSTMKTSASQINHRELRMPTSYLFLWKSHVEKADLNSLKIWHDVELWWNLLQFYFFFCDDVKNIMIDDFVIFCRIEI